MKKGLYFAIALLFAACTPPEKSEIKTITDTVESKLPETETEVPIRVKRDSVLPEVKPMESDEKWSYAGNFFRIGYPKYFRASPLSPVDYFDDMIEYIVTDEATFTSRDGAVEFFVFSPLWGGDPINYLIQQPNEEVISRGEDTSKSDHPLGLSQYWVTFEDKEGKYKRSYHSIVTHSTHHVFGFKYTTQEMYLKYKPAYLEFKKSLQQFSD